MEDNKKVKVAKTRFKGCALLWRDCVQVDRWKKDKPNITSWYKMVKNMKGKFLPNDYKVQLYERLQNLRQKDMDVQAYTEEFDKLDIRAAHEEDVEDKVAIYLGGLRYNIQDELSLSTPRIVEECYKFPMKAKEKLKRRQYKSTRGKGTNRRGKRTFSTNKQPYEDQEETSKGKEKSVDARGGFRGTRGKFGGGGSSTSFLGRCYSCNEIGHPTFKCPERQGSSSRGDRKNERRV